ncbi:MAG: 50S ribosome-binding GTPase [Pirellulales bacterium]|nr:50S ribosome-binding GTPase [Pirellulales bacterium]
MSVSSDYSRLTAQLVSLVQALRGLASEAAPAGVAGLEDREWFALLVKKLVPQAQLPPRLVVAIVGGTNIGKSVIFNHLAGENASAVTPLAAGTKHPICLVPPGGEDAETLGRLFGSFVLCPWRRPEDPLTETAEHRLYWRVGARMPPRLLLLDAPDVDSDVPVNWERANAIRQAADVLIAVLTQQKYNDAAVKRFFRHAAQADKPILVIFNQCELQADRVYWPEWLKTFRRQIGATPELVYVAPHDRRAADELRLPFYNVGTEGNGQPDRPTDLRDELAALHFDAIKVRTFRGSLRTLADPQRGIPAYLEEIRAAAGSFSAAATVLSAHELARIDWPALPAGILVEEIRAWWDAARQPWSRRIHGFYRGLGRAVLWPIRRTWAEIAGPAADPLVLFHQQERTAVLTAVKNLFDELERLEQVGNETLRPRLQRLLRGHARAELLARVQAAHQNLPAVDEDYRRFLGSELDAWRSANPRAVRFLESLDHLAALARPAITVGLFFTGLHLAGDLAGQITAHAAGQTAAHLATEAAITGGVTGGGEALVSTTSEGVRHAAGRLFYRLQTQYAKRRAAWLAAWLENELLGDLLADLRHGASLPESAAFVEVERLLEVLPTQDHVDP